jgi:5-methyltetrahydrofolate--homocysteine methyltransferase
MDVVGTRFSNGEYFLVELVMSAEIFQNAMKLFEDDLLSGQEDTSQGKIVVGTVKGDVHYIGKNLVIAFLRANGFDVYDLGEDVEPTVFVDKLKETGAKVLGLSGLITTAHDSMRDTINAIEEAGLRDQVKIMIGGGGVDKGVMEYTGADAFGTDAAGAVDLVQKLME